MREPFDRRKRSLAFRIDRKACEIIASHQKWRPGVVQFSHPYKDLTAAEEDFIAKRIAKWDSEIIRRNGNQAGD
jgi:hypothetical protein